MTPHNTLYLAGPISGMPDNNRAAFTEAQRALEAQGFTIVNPLEVTQAKTWESCMRADIKALMDCDGVVMLGGWEQSRGAQLEVHIARTLGMMVYSLAYAESVRRHAVLTYAFTKGW